MEPKSMGSESSDSSFASTSLQTVFGVLHVIVSLGIILATDKVLEKAFVAAAIKFPSALFGMFCVFTILMVIDSTVPAAATSLMNFEPALMFIQRWLPLFYVPPLVVLPLAVKDIPAASGVKICFIIALRHPTVVLKMGTYHNRNPTVSEPNTEASVPYFAWIHPGNVFSATKIGLNPFEASQMDQKSGLAAVPIRSVAPMAESAKNSEFGAKSTKVKKKKSTAKSSNKTAPNVSRPKQPKMKPSTSKKTERQYEPGTKVERKNQNIVFNEANLGFSGVPPPYCSCTGVARGCYKCGGGWQSSCCTPNISEYPLPMSPSKPGARVPGRKMSIGAYKKLLCRLAAEGHDLSHPVDLKGHWARHGTNKFVTIK